MITLQSMMNRFGDLPTLPVVATQVSELINDPNSSTGQIADLLKKDQALTAKVLKLANSSYYSIPGGVSDVNKALTYLGFNTLSQLVLSVSVVGLFKDRGDSSFSFSEFWKHALGVAVAAEALSKRVPKLKPQEAFTCGLLHDVGKLVLYTLEPVIFAQAINLSQERQCSMLDTELSLQVPTHVELGEAVVKQWKFPSVIGLAIHHHHDSWVAVNKLPDHQRSMVQVVWFANQMALHRHTGHSGDYSGGQYNTLMYNQLGIPEKDIEALEAEIVDNLDKAGAFLHA